MLCVNIWNNYERKLAEEFVKEYFQLMMASHLNGGYVLLVRSLWKNPYLLQVNNLLKNYQELALKCLLVEQTIDTYFIFVLMSAFYLYFLLLKHYFYLFIIL